MSDEILSSKIKESDLDFTQEVFRRGVLEGVRHSTPSPETLVRLSKIEETLQLKEVVMMMQLLLGIQMALFHQGLSHLVFKVVVIIGGLWQLRLWLLGRLPLTYLK